MPNWCYNKLVVTTRDDGDPKAIKELLRFKKRAKGKDTMLSLDKLVPLPDELRGTRAPSEKPSKRLKKLYGADNWYDWQVSNWGTKWDVDAELYEDDENRLEYSFDSAWSPPIPWLQKVSKMFPNLTFWMKYEEEGMGFMGRTNATNGKVDDQAIDMY